jgi:threonine aldolase
MKQIFDLRSDTFTKPTAKMKAAMMAAEVGDDVFAEDPSINALQEKAAKMFGMEAALFCPSGTMTNQIGLGVHLSPGDEVICHHDYHIYRYEGGGIASNSGAQAFVLQGTETGKFGIEELKNAIHPSDSHYPVSKVLSFENSTNRGGGDVWTIDEIKPLVDYAKSQGLKIHLDGARLFNALVATGDSAKSYGEVFDTISICLSKGLGCPVGSLLLGSNQDIQKAHRLRKRMGGGMRQAGFLAAAGSYALDHHIERLKIDHDMAKAIGTMLTKHAWVSSVKPVKTNIVICNLQEERQTEKMLKALENEGVLAMAFGPKSIRFVTHYDVCFDGEVSTHPLFDALQAALQNCKSS